jgi:N-ethylmaleimide reductase
VEHVDARRVGIKTGLATLETGAFVSTADTLPTAEYVIRRLSAYGLSHLLLMRAMVDISHTPFASLSDDGIYRHFRPLFDGTVIANVGIDQERGNRLVEEGLVDLVAYGRPYIANPDLTARFAMGVPLALVNSDTIYGASAEGYTDYPTIPTPSLRHAR